MQKVLYILKAQISTRTTFNRLRRIYDWIRGLDFLTHIHPAEVGLDARLSHRSSPSGNRYLKRILRDLNVTHLDSVLDIGCGKGSAMLSMLAFPFARVDGVEISEQIARIAITNFTKLRANRSSIFVCDAAQFVGYDRYNMFYIYNPFPEIVMQRVIDNITKYTAQVPQEIIIIYNNPICHDVIVREKIFAKIGEYPDEWGNGSWIYSNRDLKDSRLNRGVTR